MPLSDWQASLGGDDPLITIGEGTDYLWEGPIAGLGTPAPRVSDLDLPTGGILGGRDLPNSRTFSLAVIILGDDAADAMTKTIALTDAWLPSSTDQAFDIRLPGMGTLRWTGRPRGADVDLTDLPLAFTVRARLVFEAFSPAGVAV